VNAREVEQFLKDHVDEDEYYNAWSFWDYGANEVEDVPGLGAVEVIDNVGGEGQGDHVHLVFKVTSPKGGVRHFKIDGYYSSYEGTDWDGVLYEVEPREKTVTVYE